MKKNSLREWVSLQIAKNPRGMILLVILLLNIVFIVTAAVVISRLAPESLQYRGFWASVYYTITMVLDAGYRIPMLCRYSTLLAKRKKT